MWIALLSLSSSAEEEAIGQYIIPVHIQHPFIACTSGDLARLRAAYDGEGENHGVVASHVKEADAYLGEMVIFPPRGGQHNQWYQCQDCQMGLETVDATHHRCPKCETVYSGYPYDDCLFTKQHSDNLNGALATAWAYAITEDENYARHTATVLLGYAARYRDYPYHDNTATRDPAKHKSSGGHLNEQTLGEASLLSTQIAPAYDLIYDSAVLSEEDHTAIRTGLLIPMLQNLDKNKAGKSNWQSWHNAAMLWGGALLGDSSWVQKSIEAAGNGFRHQMKISVMPEGMWYENSWAYHFYTLRALTLQAEGARRLGIDLWNDDTFKKMFMLPVHYTMPDNSLPRFGDDVNSSAKMGGTMMEQAYHAYDDPAILALLHSGPTFERILLGRDEQPPASKPLLKSEVFKGTGHAILRTHGEAGLTAVMTFGPYGGSHGHFDKLSFVFFGHERELGVDPGRARSQAYRLPIHANWYKASVGHNAVLVDGKSQEPAEGKLLFFSHSKEKAAVSARCDDAYPGVGHVRTLVLMQSYLLVVDQLITDKERRFNWVYHNRGDKVMSDVATTSPDDTYPGQAYIDNAKVGSTSEPIQLRFVNGEVTTRLSMAANTDTRVLVGDGVGASMLERVPMTMLTRKGQNVSFVAVLEPVLMSNQHTVQSVFINQEEGNQLVTVERSGETDIFRITKDGHVEY